MNFLAIIQARLGSTRLPGKVLLELNNKIVLEHVFSRVENSELISSIVVATTINRDDLEIVKFCSNKNIRIYCGSEDDVLDRYYQVAKLIKPENIVRITSDCPVIDPKIIDQVLKVHLAQNADYTSNTLIETFPDGQDIEVFKFSALEKAWKESSLFSEREHVTPYIRKHPELFSLYNVISEVNYSEKRWTLDTKEDYLFLQKIFDKLYNHNNFFGMNDIIEFLKDNSQIEQINNSIKRNEGYLKSLLKDKI